MERAERMILLGIGFLSPELLVPVLWVMLGLTLVTAVGRFAKVWRLAEGPVTVPSPRRQRRVQGDRPRGRPQGVGVPVAVAGPSSRRAGQPFG